MRAIPFIGAACLGMVVGFLVRYFIRRFDKYGPAALGSVLTIVLGGAAVKYLQEDKSVWWCYPIGLFLGFVIYQLAVILHTEGGHGPTGSKPSKWDIHDPRFLE